MPTSQQIISLIAEVFKEEKHMNFLIRWFYKLTAFIPRRLPRTEEELWTLKLLLMEVFGVPDKPQSWSTVAGYIASTPAHSMYRSYLYYVNAVRRLDVNQVVQVERQKCMVELQHLLAEKIKKYEDEEKAKANKVKPVDCEGSECEQRPYEFTDVGAQAFEDGAKTDCEGLTADIPLCRKAN